LWRAEIYFSFSAAIYCKGSKTSLGVIAGFGMI
ncbi:MAG: hypothetical protein ACI9QL_005436, partial [Candidatus Omnitrophota bacterium]